MTELAIVALTFATIVSRPEELEAVSPRGANSTVEEYRAELSPELTCLPVVVLAADLHISRGRFSRDFGLLELDGHGAQPFVLVVPRGSQCTARQLVESMPRRFLAVEDRSTGLFHSFAPTPQRFGLLPTSRTSRPVRRSRSRETVRVWLSAWPLDPPVTLSGESAAYILHSSLAPSEAGTK